MNPRELLRSQIDTLVASLRVSLDAAAPVHVTATSRAGLANDMDVESALNDGGINGEAKKMPPIRHGDSR